MAFNFFLAKDSLGTPCLCAIKGRYARRDQFILGPLGGICNEDGRYAIRLDSGRPMIGLYETVSPINDEDGVIFLKNADGSLQNSESSIEEIEETVIKTGPSPLDTLACVQTGKVSDFVEFLRRVFDKETPWTKQDFLKTAASNYPALVDGLDFVVASSPEGFSKQMQAATFGITDASGFHFCCSRGLANYIDGAISDSLNNDFERMLMRKYFEYAAQEASDMTPDQFDIDKFFGVYEVKFPDASQLKAGKVRITLGLEGKISPDNSCNVSVNGTSATTGSFSESGGIVFEADLKKGVNKVEVTVAERAPDSEAYPDWFDRTQLTRKRTFSTTYMF